MNKSLFALSLLAASSAQAEGTAPYTPDAGPEAGNYEATLTGSGQSSDDFDDNNFGVTGSVGYYVTKNWVWTVKQTALLADDGNSSLLNGRTIVQAAYQWDQGRWQPYLGMNVGGLYGAGVRDDGLFGPELGLKYYVNESTFLFGNIAYEMRMDECCNDGNVPYALGVGFNF